MPSSTCSLARMCLSCHERYACSPMITAFNTRLPVVTEEQNMSQPNDARNGMVHHAGETVTGTEWSQIREALRGLRYGTVSIIVQDGVVVQIDRLEKRRIRRGESSAPSAPHTQH